MHQKVCFTCKVNTFLKIFENGDFFPVTEKNPSTRSICKSFSTVLTKTLTKTMEIIDRIQNMPCMMSGIVVLENLRFRSSTLRPYPYVSVFVWKRNFFSPVSKNFGSTHSISPRFGPSTRIRWIDLKTITYLTAHVWRIRVERQEREAPVPILNKFLIWRGVDWNW